MLQDGCFENAADARLESFDSIEGYYNTHRKHASPVPATRRCLARL
jgi:hypothetical protein